jgi:hypothetical protein
MLKQKLLNAISAHPKLATFGIGLAMTMAVGTAIGMVEVQQAHGLVIGALAATTVKPALSARCACG